MILVLFAFGACGGDRPNDAAIDPYYLCGSKENRETLEDLFTLLGQETGEAERFTAVREIANAYLRLKEYGRLSNFLNDQVERNPQNIYNGYYRFMTAFACMEQEAYPPAALYFDLILKNYPDLSVMGKSLHLACLTQLITLVRDPERQARYYEELISRFSSQIDLGAAYFMLGQAYEQTGEWNGAIQAYTQFLPFMGTEVPGFPNAASYAKQLVDFNNSPKNWSAENLNSLVSAIKAALDEGNSRQLERYRAKVNFFARSWEQEETDDAGMAEFSLADFVRGNRIRYAQDLDKGSSANEAYLRSSGWSQYISTWYLYFRKIYFPADPEIHGRWEWAGVYYGEKF